MIDIILKCLPCYVALYDSIFIFCEIFTWAFSYIVCNFISIYVIYNVIYREKLFQAR